MWECWYRTTARHVCLLRRPRPVGRQDRHPARDPLERPRRRRGAARERDSDPLVHPSGAQGAPKRDRGRRSRDCSQGARPSPRRPPISTSCSPTPQAAASICRGFATSPDARSAPTAQGPTNSASSSRLSESSAPSPRPSPRSCSAARRDAQTPARSRTGACGPSPAATSPSAASPPSSSAPSGTTTKRLGSSSEGFSTARPLSKAPSRGARG